MLNLYYNFCNSRRLKIYQDLQNIRMPYASPALSEVLGIATLDELLEVQSDY